MSVLWYFELVGVIIAGLMFFDWFCEFYYYLRAYCAHKNLKKYGRESWALITGATDGIGLGFAKVLAKNNFNIILVSRNPDKLASVEGEIKSYGVQAISISKDFSKCPENPEEFFNDIDEKTRDLDVSILVNNIGWAVAGHFHDSTPQEVANQNALNIWPIVYMTKIFARRMLNRAFPSAIINLSSVGSLVPVSGLTVYCAGKSFDHLFTLDANEEIRYLAKNEKLKGIDMLSLQPGLVQTPLIKDFYSKPLVISPESCAENALRVLGKVNYSSVHWKHMIYAMGYRNIPWYINAKVSLKTLLKSNKRNS
ncbi:hypothetical protein SteCoe_27000 [Stentor coeruleus]|uniref:Steroid dehydrogenase n=1 Tax=Stentor coeruleus TaxID=5963 RepID=A0A1R2BBU6_9CILI|nr:hypothetical protein SteCoe_27000 [Stentor coeruleus]